jgi:integrase
MVPARRGKGEGAVYQRSDGKWCASLDLGHRDGKRVRKVLYGKTREGVKNKLLAAQREHAASALVTASPTVEQWMRYWLLEVAPGRVRPKTLEGYRGYVEKHIIPGIGKHRLDKLEPSHVRTFYNGMRKKGMAELSVRQAHAILSRALTIAGREGKVGRNVCKLIDAPKSDRNPRDPLTVAEARAVLTAAKGDPFEARWYVALYEGLRQGEALGLAWHHVNLDEGWLFVERALQRQMGQGLVFVQPKSEASVRRVPLLPMVRARLAVMWAEHLAAGGTTDDLVWSNNGKPIEPRKDYQRWTDLLKRAGVPHAALHAARNTTGSLLMAAGVGDKVTQEILGHSTVQVTQEHYLRGDITQRNAAMLALEQYVTEG